MTSPTLNDLFPNPPPRVSPLVPERWPGVCATSTRALIETAKADYENFHVYFNHSGFHNHTSHHLFALWALGGDADVIRAAYSYNAKMQRPLFDSPSPITSANWKSHLGDENYYKSYLQFFASVVLTNGIETTLETYLMSDDANVTSIGEGDGKVLMLARFVAAVIHPMIHLGHGCEFVMPGMIAEGLAWTAVHQTSYASILPPSVFDGVAPEPAAGDSSHIASALGSLALKSSLNDETKHLNTPEADMHYKPKGAGPHAFTILARAMKDPLLALTELRGDVNLLTKAGRNEHTERRRQRVVELAEEWAQGVNLSIPGTLEQKIEELAWTNTLTYGVGGSATKGAPFFADFFLMHCVTSSLFLPSILRFLQPASQTRLLRVYFTVSLTYYIVRGRPVLDLRAFFADPVPPLEVPGTHPTPSKTALLATSSHNPWYAVLQSTLLHPEAHVSKCERALVHWANLYGERPRGYWAALAGGPDGLEGAEDMDGSLFVRAAALTLHKVGWVREGEDATFWDR